MVMWLDTGTRPVFVYHTRDCAVLERERRKGQPIIEAATPPERLRWCEACQRDGRSR